MAKTAVRESTPLLHGTDNVQAQDVNARSNASRTQQSRRWKFAASGAALLCAGALVSSKLQMDASSSSPSSALSKVMSGAQVSMNKQQTVVDEEPAIGPATVEFYKALEAFKNEIADPCVDFYEYACGGWLAQNEIPSDGATIDSAFYAVGEDNKKIIRKIIDSNPPLISEFYASCLNAEDVDKDAVAYVAKLIDSIHQINSTVGLLSYAGELDQSYGISSFFSVGVGADPKDPTTNLLQLSQGGLTLPSREYYLEASKSEQYSALFAKYVSDLFAVEGLENHNASEYASAVYETETKFAEISLTNAELRDPWTTNDAYSFADIDTDYPFLAAYLDGISKQEPFPKTHAIIGTPAFFKAQHDVLKSVDTQQLKQYLSFHVLDSFGATLGEYFRRASHDFHGTVQGAGALSTRDKFCVDSTTSYLGAYLGEYYMEEVFGPDAKASAQALVQEIEASMKRLLQTEQWLDRITYDAAVAKLERVRNYIGGPDAVPDLPFELHADNYFDNVVSLLQLGASETIQSVGEPVDATKWGMFASTVNAYYDPSANKMVFPAAILQPPFYSADKFPSAANYARIGMVMGHELSHGFDDQGRNYDGNGTLRKWWSASVSDDFTARAQCLSAQYSSFPVVTEDGVLLGNVNGDLTLGENIADNGGIHLAYQAYKLSQVKEEGEAGDETPAAPETDEPTVPVVPVVTKEKKEKKKEETKPEDEKDVDDKKKKVKSEKDKDQDEKKAEKSKSEKGEDKKKSEKSKSEKDEDEKDDKKEKKSDKEEDKKSKSKKVDEKEDKEGKKPKDKKDSKKDDDNEEDEKSKKSKKSEKDNEDEEDDKKSKKSKKDEDDEEEDKKSKKSKKSKDDEKDDEDDNKKSKKHKSKKDEDGKEDDKKHKPKKEDEDEEDDKKSKKHKPKKEDEEDEEDEKKSKKHKSKKENEDDEDEKRSKSKKHKDDEDEGGKKSKSHKQKKDDDKEEDKKHKSKKDDKDDEEEKHHKKHHHHLRRQLAFASIKLSKMKAVAPEAPAGGKDELSAEIKDDRLFFTAFAQNWCEKRAPAYAELLRATDPHSPGRWRVNGPLKNFDKFAAAFQCKLGTPMNPDTKCLVW